MAKLNSGTRIYGNLAIDTWANIGTIVQAATINAATIGNSGATLTGTISTAAQTNITSVGTLGTLTITGNTSIGSSPDLTTKANLYVFGGNLGATIGTEIPLAVFSTTNSNFSALRITNYRNAQGASWITATTKIQQRIDVTDQGYIEFNPLGSNYGVDIGSGTTPYLRAFYSSGNIVIPATTTSTSTTTGALVVAGGAGIAGRVTAGNVVTTSGVFWANGAVYSTGAGGGGSSLTYTADASPPGSPVKGDIWYNTTTDVIYTYTYDGVSSYWLDLESAPTLSVVAADAAGTAMIMGVALG